RRELYCAGHRVAERRFCLRTGSCREFPSKPVPRKSQGRGKKSGRSSNDYVDPAFSPDGRRIAVVIRNIQELEVLERDRGTVSNISPHFAHFAPVWTVDGKYLVLDAVPRDADNTFSASLYRQRGIYRIAVDDGSEPQLLRSIPQVTH